MTFKSPGLTLPEVAPARPRATNGIALTWRSGSAWAPDHNSSAAGARSGTRPGIRASAFSTQQTLASETLAWPLPPADDGLLRVGDLSAMWGVHNRC